MSFLKAFQIYSSLSPGEKEFVKKKKLEGNYPASTWLSMFKNVAEFDRHGDAFRTFLGWMIFLSIVGGLAPFITGIVKENEGLFKFSLIGAGFFVFFLTFFLIMKGKDVHNNFREFVFPLMSILGEETTPDEPLTLKLDFRGSTLKEKQIRENKPQGGFFSYPKITETFFSDPWIEGSVRLADRSRLVWEVKDNVRKRTVTKRTYRGKIKTKTKYKVKRVLDMSLRLPGDSYSFSGPRTSAGGFKVKAGEKGDTFCSRCSRSSSDLNFIMDLNLFLDNMASVYKQVKTISK